MLHLSNRLKALAAYVPLNAIIGDIGADHGLLPLYLFMTKIINKAYACDNKEGPYQNLKKTFALHKYDITIAKKDGLKDLPSFVNFIIISGMGGELITKILEQGKIELSHVDTLLLSPQGNEELLRRWLHFNHWKIEDETVIKEDKFYFILLAKRGEETYSELEYRYGKILLKKREEVWIASLIEMREYIENILNTKNLSIARKEELEKQKLQLNAIIKGED